MRVYVMTILEFGLQAQVSGLAPCARSLVVEGACFRQLEFQERSQAAAA
jgi:hypothetical protein